ncbi:MAG: hypothetical protein JNM56_04985 [Planctomycetia bacterium]|nr:hypothetical protein [Planctomycetia bacterium]
MSRLIGLRYHFWLGGLFVCAFILGCGDANTGGEQANNNGGDTPRRRPRPATSAPERDPNNRITGTAPWHSGRATEPQPKALERDAKYQGKVTAATEGVSLTVSGNQGNMTFQYEGETNVVASGDPRFFPYKGELDNQDVTVIYYVKNGQNFARLITVGTRGFGEQPKQDN